VNASIQIGDPWHNSNMHDLPAACGAKVAKIDGYMKSKQATVFSRTWSWHEGAPWPVGS
jgi:hypothetical protein